MYDQIKSGLSIRGLACSRGGVPVLRGVEFEAAPGEAVVLRGPNGSGKTTLLRTIAGLQPPLEGEIIADPDSIAYAAHADGLKATLTVAENLEFWASVYGTHRIDDALDAFDIRALANRYARNLSAGQKRRLGLARLLVTDRQIWLLDEPTVSLDAASTALFAASVLRHLEARGSAILATHIDLGFDARIIEMTQFKDTAEPSGAFDEAFL